MASLLDLFVKIGVDDKEAVKGIDSISKKGEGLSKVFKGVVGAVSAISTAAIALGGAFIKGAMDVSNYGSDINDMSQKMNISKKGFQEWKYVLSQSGTDVGVLQMGLKTLSNAAVSGSAAFKTLGISQEQLSTLSTEELFNTTIEKLAGMEAGSERTALASDLFGRSATELLPILNMGADGLDEMKKQAEDYGLIMSDEAIKASDDFGDSVNLMQQTLTGMKNRMMGEFLPSLTLVTDGLAKLFTGDTSGLDGINKGITGFVDKIAAAIPKVIEIGGSILQTLATAIMNNMPMLVTTAFNLISSLAMFVLENIPMLLQTALTIMTTLMTGLAEQAPVLIPAIVTAILMMVDTLINNIDMLVDAAIQLTMGIAQGLISALPILVKKIPVMITALVNAILANLPLLIQAAIQITIALVKGLIQSIPQLVAAVPQMMAGIFKAFGTFFNQVLDVGKNIVSGIWQGISNSFSWIKSRISEWVGNVVSFIKKLFKIKSPSGVMREEIGKYLPMGIGEGIEKYADVAESAMSDLMNSLTGQTFSPTISANVNASGGRLASINAGATGNNLAVSNSPASKPMSINIPLIVDGREIARATARYTGEQLSWMGA